jgi:hypothetical protein
MADGHDQRGRFTKGNKKGLGRPVGARNKPYDMGTLFLDGEQTPTFRRFRDLLLGIVNDLGGRDTLSVAQLQLARRCSMICTQCELMEQQTVAGAPLDLIAYGTLTGHLVRALRELGVKRQPRDVTPTLRDYLDAAQQPAEPDEDLVLEEEN